MAYHTLDILHNEYMYFTQKKFVENEILLKMGQRMWYILKNYYYYFTILALQCTTLFNMDVWLNMLTR
jgi:hypothetical protein